jgi:hypothetical protein
MKLHLLRNIPTQGQLQDMLEAQGGYIKLAVDSREASSLEAGSIMPTVKRSSSSRAAVKRTSGVRTGIRRTTPSHSER